jgi:hypothetical protein
LRTSISPSIHNHELSSLPVTNVHAPSRGTSSVAVNSST